MRVRSLTDSDLTAALDLWARTEHLAPVDRAELEAVRRHDGDLVLTAVEDDLVVGVIVGTYDGRRGWIQRLAVDPQARRLGVARMLVAELEARLVARGCRKVNLLVYDDNAVGRSLWDALGYRGTDRVALYHRSLHTDEVPGGDGQGQERDAAPGNGSGC